MFPGASRGCTVPHAPEWSCPPWHRWQKLDPDDQSESKRLKRGFKLLEL